MAKKKKQLMPEDILEEVPEAQGMEVTSIETGSLSDLPEGFLSKLNTASLSATSKVESEETSEEPKPAPPIEDVEEKPKIVMPPQVRSAMKESGLTDHMVELMADLERFRESSNIDMLSLYRRKIRYRLFRIRDGGKMGEQADEGLKAHIENQFSNGMNWNNFTFEWDVAPNNPLMVISKDIINYEWIRLGGEFRNDKKYPPAFTKQA